MGLKLSELSPSKETLEKGEWVEFDPANGVKLLLVPTVSNKPYQSEITTAYLKATRNGRLPNPERSRRDTVNALVKHRIVRDWEGILADDGNPIEFNDANLRDALVVDAIYTFVLREADDVTNFPRHDGEEPSKEAAKSGAPVAS